LHVAQDVYITAHEAASTFIDKPTWYEPDTNMHVMEVEAFHYLHCLNYIRKSIDIDHYPDLVEPGTWRIHLGHCINSIREYLMCKADLTPIRLVPPAEAGTSVPVPDFMTTHVCRDYMKVFKYATKERSANTHHSEAIIKKLRASIGE
jgi:hypothetical protein